MDFNFYNRLADFLPTFNKREVLISADKTHEFIVKHTIPVIESAAQVYQGQKFKDNDVKRMTSNISAVIKGTNAFDSILTCMQKAAAIVMYCNDYADKIFSNTEARQGLTFAKFTLMRTTQAAEFASKYARKFLNFVLAREAQAAGVDGLECSKKESEWVDANFSDFIIALRALDRDVEQFKAHLSGLPDAIISEATERTFVSTIGQSKYDPMNLRNFSVAFNPFYFFGMLRVQWQERCYESAQADLALIQMRILHLRRLQEKQNDAKLEKQIEYHQIRANKFQQEIDEMERDWKLEA